MGKRPIVRPDWLSRTLKQRFDEKWIPESFSGCWLWTGSVNAAGYGRLSYRLKPVHAHRISWLIAHGEMPPDDVLVCHRCDVKSCVNPDHLFLGTYSDNLRDAIAKGIHGYSRSKKNWMEVRTPKRNPPETCKHGHPYPKHLYIGTTGNRYCRECSRLSQIRMRTNLGKPPVLRQ